MGEGAFVIGLSQISSFFMILCYFGIHFIGPCVQILSVFCVRFSGLTRILCVKFDDCRCKGGTVVHQNHFQ